MNGLIQSSGQLRKGNVGVKSGQTVIHMAPPYTEVPHLMNNLFSFLKREEELHPLVKSGVFHYELEFIHPFIDGNGRIGRLWQSAILYHYRTVFEYIPIESVIKNRQMEYYDALQTSNKQGESTVFIRFMLETILQAVVDFTKQAPPENQTTAIRIQMAKDSFRKALFMRKEYIKLHRNISTATASRDLAIAVKKNFLKKTGDKATTKYQFK
jgi:Fic family protein